MIINAAQLADNYVSPALLAVNDYLLHKNTNVNYYVKFKKKVM